MWALKAAFGLIIALILLWRHPTPHYQFARHKDTIDGYRQFLSQHPSSEYVPAAQERIRILSEDSAWADANVSDSLPRIRHYMRVYPEGKYTNDAKRSLERLTERAWKAVAKSRSESDLRQFIKAHRESSHAQDAEARIQELWKDFSWVQEQDTIEAYKRYLELNPRSPVAASIQKRIIDLEVAAIAAGEHGDLPQAQALSINSSSPFASISIDNQTGYELTVRYSGRDSQKIVIAVGATESLRLRTGDYTIAASVSASRVRNYAGAESIVGGEYKSRFYVTSERGTRRR